MWIFGLHSADTIHEASNATATGRTIQDLRSWRVWLPNRTTFHGWTFPNRPNQARPPGGARGAELSWGPVTGCQLDEQARIL